MRTKLWIAGWFLIVISVLILIGRFVYNVDPYFHYHKPLTDTYYYELNNQRSQNNGISKYFDYDAMITGTSMTENFKTSEMDELFNVNSIKITYAGGTFKEINDNLSNALRNNSNLKLVVRALDIGMFFDDPNKMREDLGEFPTYLYDDNTFNDVNYLFNKDVIFQRAYAMTKAREEEGFTPGITSFDDYSSTRHGYAFGVNALYPEGLDYKGKGSPVHMTPEEKEVMFKHITKNVTSIADEYPETEFYYYFSPYCITYFQSLMESGKIYRFFEAEQYVIELILEHDNIKLFSFSDVENIVTDLNNYKDFLHYAPWINSYFLRCMHDDLHRLTKDNYKKYLEDEQSLYLNYNYNTINEQLDYPNDLYAAALFNETAWGVKPIDIIAEYKDSIELKKASLIEEQYDNKEGIRCVGSLLRSENENTSIEEYIRGREYIGAKINIENIGKHNYLVFYGKKISGRGQPAVFVYDKNNNKVGEVSASYNELDVNWNQYVIDLSDVKGDITVYLNGGYIDSTGGPDSEYIFSNIVLY